MLKTCRLLMLIPTLTLTATLLLARTTYAANLSFGCDLALSGPPQAIPKTTGPRIATFEGHTFNLSKEEEVKTDADIIIVDDPIPHDVWSAVEAGYLEAPYEVGWIQHLLPFELFLDRLEKSQRSQLLENVTSSQELVRSEIGPLTAKDLGAWFIDPHWAEANGKNLKNYHKIFFYQDETGELLGGAILHQGNLSFNVLFETYSAEGQELNLAYRAFAEIMNYGSSHSAKTLTYAPEPNFFVSDVPVKKTIDKFQMGMQPFFPSKAKSRLVKILNPDAFDRDYLIFALKIRVFAETHYFTDHPQDLPWDNKYGFHVYDLREEN